VHDDGGSFGRQDPGDFLAQAAARSGDESPLATEV
jgi:hypothetical protein